jgi:hypothetical protein
MMKLTKKGNVQMRMIEILDKDITGDAADCALVKP